MAKLNRVTGKIFGATASPSGDDPEIGQFGSAKAGTYNGTSDISTIQGLPAWSNGWIDAVTPSNQYPPLPERTGVDKVLSYQECYLLQQGIPEWDGGTTYYENGFCSYNGIIYKSLIDENLNKQPDISPDAWEVYGAINDYANQDLQNLSDLGNARLQYAPFSINAGTVLNGKNNTLYLGSFIKTYSEAGTYTLEITEAGNYEVEMYGAGGGASYYQWAGTGSSVAARISTGGSGAGFKGVITLPIGTYTVTVGAAGADRMQKSGNYYDGGTASTGGTTSLDSLIIAGGGTGGHAKPTIVDGVGGAVTIDAGATIVSTELNVSGNNGNRSYASGWTAPNLAGGRSVYDNTTTGYGAGGGKPQTAIDGFFGIRKVSGSAATLGCDVCTITTCDGRTKVNSEAVQQDVSTLADGTYSVFKDYSTGVLSLKNSFKITKIAPSTPSDGDYWLDISTIPVNLKYYDTSDWAINNDLVYIGECTIASNAITDIVNCDFNASQLGKFELVNAQLLNNTSTGSWTIDLSTYIPNDKFEYEVYFNGRWVHYNNSNAGNLVLTTDMLSMSTMVGSSNYGGGDYYVMAPLKTKSVTITSSIGGSGGTISYNFCYLIGYRRKGI